MEPRSQYMPFLQRVLTPPRLEHTLGVAQVMEELAGIYRLDREQALAAALLHDAGKDLNPEQQAEILKTAAIRIFYPCDEDYVLYLHGPVGAHFVRKELGIEDELVLDAITMHTFYGEGANFDAPLVWCLRFADVLEPRRSWWRAPGLRDEVKRLQETVYLGRMDEGICIQTGWLVRWFEATGRPVHPNMHIAYKDAQRRREGSRGMVYNDDASKI